jgi:hypothetical protein
MWGRWLPLFIVLVVETHREAKTKEATETSTLIN